MRFISRCRTTIWGALVLSAFAFLGAPPATAAGKQVVIASGGQTGVYYPVAVAICRLFNTRFSFHGYGCKVQSTGGSVDNLKRLRLGEANFAIVQSDWQAHSYNGTDAFSDAAPHEALRSLVSLYSESFTVLAHQDSNIQDFEDLRERRVNIGNPGSGQRATMELLLKSLGWTRFDFSAIREFNADQQSQALCDREVDAIVFVAGHPSGTIKSATQYCNTNFVNVEGPGIDALVEADPSYSHTTIPTSLYFRDQERKVPTFGLSATLVTTSDASDELVERLLSVVFEDVEKLKRLHPALTNLDENIREIRGATAPIHPAAEEFYSSSTN